MLDFLIGFYIVGTIVALIVMIIVCVELEKGWIPSSYSSWQYARRDNSGRLREKQNERETALEFLKAVGYWTLLVLWPFILPYLIVRGVAKCYQMFAQLSASLRGRDVA